MKGNCDKCGMTNCALKGLDKINKSQNILTIKSLKDVKKQVETDLPQIQFEGMLSRIKFCYIDKFGEFRVSKPSYTEVYSLNRMFCQEKVNLAFYALRHINEWNFIDIPKYEATKEGHETKPGIVDSFWRGYAQFNDLKIEFVLRSNNMGKAYYLHNVVVNDL